MTDQELYEKIEAYLNGDLKGTDLIDFEQQMKSDKNLSSKVAMFKGLDSAISNKPVLDFQKLVEDQGSVYLAQQKNHRPPLKKINRRRILAFAASFLLLAAAVFLWKSQSNSHLSNQKLFTEHFETYKLNESLRDGGSGKDDFDTAIQIYQSGNYLKSAEQFQLLVDQDKSNMTYAFCLAQSYLNHDPRKLQLAKLEFEKVVAEGNSIYVPASKWYLALIALVQEDQSTSKALLEQLESGSGNWSVKAKKLKSQLD